MKNIILRCLDWVIAASLAVFTALLMYPSLATFTFPGESAHLLAVWRMLDTADPVAYPLARLAATVLSPGNALAPLFSIVSVLLLYAVMRVFIARLCSGDKTEPYAVLASRVGAIFSCVVFVITPAVRSASTHLEPRLFDAMWALLAFAVFIPAMQRSSRALVCSLLAGIIAGVGLSDSPMFLFLLPIYVVFACRTAGSTATNRFVASAILIISFAVSFFVFGAATSGSVGELMVHLSKATKSYFEPKCWLLVVAFSVLPALVSVFSSKQSFGGSSGFVSWLFHVAITVTSILAVATPLAPGSLMLGYGVLPVASSLFAAIVAGYILSYWMLVILISPDVKAMVPTVVYAVVMAIALLFDLFSFDSDRGSFADKVAEKLIDCLDGRDWFVSDGTLDDHLRLKADEKGVKLNIVSLKRDLDKAYIEDLNKRIEEDNLCGEKNAELRLSLSIGVLSFVQDFLAADPEAPKRVAIFGAPDLWYGAGLTAVPEFIFFGGDKTRDADWSAWKDEFSGLLSTKEDKWGSYGLWRCKDPLEWMRLNLRRHLGFVANDRGVWLQEQKRDDEAFDMYELVLHDIDADNVCALFNEFEMARAGYPRAVKNRRQLDAKLRAIVDDADRRYRLWSLGNYYGYIRNPEIFIRLGFNWARSGRPGEALAQMRRAVDLIPSDNRMAFMNMMAALYASENDRQKSHAIYKEILEKDASNHEALICMMRLSLLEGDGEKALLYLQKAVEEAGDDPRYRLEAAMLHLMRGDLKSAKASIKEVTDADRSNLQAWSLLAAVTIQEIDIAKTPEEKAKLLKSLEDDILVTMEKQARNPNEYYLQTTRAFILLQHGQDMRKRREARDALVAAAKERPDIIATSDMILGLDISLNDTVDAERHAREVLSRNRKAPLANYVMGSLALQRGKYSEAEMYLRRAADAERPISLALNDLSEVLRRNGNLADAELYARKAVEREPGLYVAWETLSSVILDAGGNLDEAERCAKKAVELSKDKDGREADIRMLITLARVQFARGETLAAKMSLRRVSQRVDELSDFEKRAYEELRDGAK